MPATTPSRAAISIRSRAGARRSPRHFVWWVRDDLDLNKMRQTAGRFAGLKDFRSFTDDSADEKSTVVAIERIEMAEDGDLVVVRVEGSHFLWKMVRRMVGVMVDVGLGGTTIEQAASFLSVESESRPN